MIKRTMIAFLALYFLSACQPSFEPGAGGDLTDRPAVNLEETIWHLQSITLDGVTTKVQPLSRFTIEFADGRVNGWTGCRGFDQVRYSQGGLSLQIDWSGAVFSTSTCDEETKAQETILLEALDNVRGAEKRGDNLVLLLDNGTMEFYRDGNPPPPQDATLEGTRWNLVAMVSGDERIEPLPDTRPSLDFENGHAGGSTGCNQFGGAYVVEGDTLRFGEVASTLMACVNDHGDVMAQEAEYLARLRQVSSFTLAGNELVLHQRDGGRLVYRPAENQTLEGVTWHLVGLAEDEALVSTWVDERITAEFAEGQIRGSGGCNQYSAEVSLSGTEMSIGPAIMTEMACEPDIMAREGAFLAILERVTGFRLVRERLELLDADGRLLAVFSTQPEGTVSGDQPAV